MQYPAVCASPSWVEQLEAFADATTALHDAIEVTGRSPQQRDSSAEADVVARGRREARDGRARWQSIALRRYLHFALETHATEVAGHMRRFLGGRCTRDRC